MKKTPRVKGPRHDPRPFWRTRSLRRHAGCFGHIRPVHVRADGVLLRRGAYRQVAGSGMTPRITDARERQSIPSGGERSATHPTETLAGMVASRSKPTIQHNTTTSRAASFLRLRPCRHFLTPLRIRSWAILHILSRRQGPCESALFSIPRNDRGCAGSAVCRLAFFPNRWRRLFTTREPSSPAVLQAHGVRAAVGLGNGSLN